MHEVFLGGMLKDYLSGKDIPQTTYEDLRQGLARMLVEEKHIPMQRIIAKKNISFRIDDDLCEAFIDLAILDELDAPLCALFFCPGDVATFIRESVAMARIYENRPFPVVLITDTIKTLLVKTKDLEILETSARAFKNYGELKLLAREYFIEPYDCDTLLREKRIVNAFSSLRAGCCPHNVNPSKLG